MKKSLSDSRLAFALFAVALAAGIAAPCANADEWNKRTILTVNETIQVQDAVLQPGQYVMRLLDSSSDRHVVQIFNGRENHIVATNLAIPKERLHPTGETQFTFWETPSGTGKAMRDWFYPGDLVGQEFRYPKNLYQVAMVTPEPAPAPSALVTPPPEANETTPPPETTPAPVAQQPTPDTSMDNAAPPEETPAPITPSAEDQAAAPPASPEPQPPPPAASLPQTGSPYPTLGIAGVVLLVLGGVLRLRQMA